MFRVWWRVFEYLLNCRRHFRRKAIEASIDWHTHKSSKKGVSINEGGKIKKSAVFRHPRGQATKVKVISKKWNGGLVVQQIGKG